MIPSPTATGPLVADSPAAEKAEQNWAANLSAIRALQPGLGSVAGPPDDTIEWLFARDGALTAMRAGDRWWAGCSVPLAAARFMLKKMEAGGNVACFLSPVHAAQVRVALDRLGPHQAIVAIVPDAATLWVMLHGEDFSHDLTSHRLWFAAGENWEAELERLFVENPGLPTPAQFIRPILADPEPADRLIAPAQKIFASQGALRAEQIRQLASTRRNRRPVRRVCLIAPGQFRLWDPSAQTLARVIERECGAAIELARFDSDDPASASPLVLASLIAGCDAVVAANTARADVPEVAPHGVPWITWVTTTRVPSGESAGPDDHLLLADAQWRSSARARGWAEHRIHVAGWPRVARGGVRAGGPLVLVADTEPLQPPKKVEDFSSHKLLWEMIGDELLNDPFAVGDDVEKYLSRRMSRLQIAEAGFDRTVFIDRLIAPAFQQGLARLLIREAVPVKLHGKGWDQIEPLSSNARGPVSSSAEFDEIVDGAAALIHPWPSRDAHPIDAIGRPVLRAFGLYRDSFLRDARTLLAGDVAQVEPPSGPVITWRGIAPLLP